MNSLHNNINAILFDLGGVLINLDFSLTEKAFVKLGAKHFNSIYSPLKQSRLFDDFDKGIVSETQFRNELKKHLPANADDAAIDKAWNAMLLDFPRRRLELLVKLRKKYRVFLLSNTNSIHIREVNSILKKSHGMDSLHPFFENFFYSFETGMRKPDRKIFEYVLKSTGLNPENVFFIDDSPQHVEGAKSLGIPSYLLRKGEEAESLFR